MSQGLNFKSQQSTGQLACIWGRILTWQAHHPLPLTPPHKERYSLEHGLN
ncbi:predicted protein [Histoplasma mississippiense (nom. inval.)]|nr:predicted protein [Histoplasma mississippiense (nom. inval.)]EDN09540.1 predicted protein [Histoplasma mississippiense (nom. inval.)]